MSRVLIFRPNFEVATRYGHAWLGEISRLASAMGHSVLDLEGESATPENWNNAIETFKPDLVVAMGHGDSSRFTGQNAEIVLTACQNDGMMTGTQSYMLSCLMGQTLAPSMDEKNARTVAAYISEFTWVVHPDYIEDPLNDPRAYPFYRAVVEPTGRLLAGATWKEWYDLSVAEFNRGVKEWFEDPDPTASQVVASLEHDRDSLIVLGETSIRPALRFRTPLELLIPVALGSLLLIL